ncbi:MAG: CzcA family heavy metal efflux pump [Crocinitomix sp.]|jgi:CzcA family heavy metal efflux pump
MIKQSFKNPYLVIVFATIVILLSGVLIPRMPVDILPQFEKSAMQILTLYPGMPAEVVEKDITSRMERWTGQSPGIEKQLSKSIMGVSIVTNFYGADVDPAEAMANTSAYAMSDMYYQPPGTLPPMVQPFDPTASKPLMLLTVSSETKSGKELYDIAYYNLRQMLSSVKGIVAPAAYGGSKRRIHIYVDPSKLEALGISQTEVNDAIQENTTMIPSGIAEIGSINYGIDAKGMIIDVEDFNDIIVAYRDGKPIYVSDIGYASDASVIQTNIARVDSREQVYLPIFKRPGANTVASVEAVKEAIPALKARMPDDVQLDVIFDQSSYVRNAISGLTNAGLGGLVLVIIVLVMFLGNWRSALVVAISLPLSVLFAFCILSFSGEAINSITLGGIVLVLGLLVDNSIVVIENIDRHLNMGKKSWEAALDAALEVATPVLASTLVIIVVFFPVIFLTGIAKFLFSPLAITVGAAMIGSYIFSLTLVPLMAAYLFRNRLPKGATEKKRNFLGFFQRFIDYLKGKYQASLNWALKFRWGVLGITVLAFIGSLFIMNSQLGYELFPKSDVGQMEIQVRMESGTPLKTAEATIIEMEDLIREELGTDLEQMISNIGIFYDLPAAYTPNSGTQDAFIGLQLKENHSVSTFEYARRLRKVLRTNFPGVELSFDTGGLITAALNEGKPTPIDVQIIGNDLHVLREISEDLKTIITEIPSTRDVRILQRIDQPTKDINIDRIKAAQLGVKPVDAIKNVVSALNSSATFDKSFWIDERNGNHYYVGVTYPEYLINDEHSLDNITVMGANGVPVPFRNFSNITESLNPVEINHYNLQREFNVYANVEGQDIGSVSDEIQQKISEMEIPEGYEVVFQGEIATMKNSFGDLGFGLLLSVILTFLIILPLFRSFKQPLIIIMAFPLGIIGVALAMWITGTNLNIQSLMGIIMMVGISVSYGNILIDRINSLVKEGSIIKDAISNGAADRFRPVLMTAATTIFGLLPTALATNPGSEANVPLAVAVIGGTFMATLLTLYIIPILYLMMIKTNKK